MKRILYTLIGVMFSVGAWAQTSLQEQINSAEAGTTITLNADVNLTEQVEISGKNITIDLNGHTIGYSGSGLNSGILLVHNGAGLTINATNGGAINSGIAMAAIALTKKGDDASHPAKLVINGGTITGGNYGITGNGSRPNTDITINGGTITATVENDNFGIYHPQDGKLTITGGNITAYSAAIEMRAGELKISGGTFTATATEYSCNPNGSGTTTVGAALAIAQHTTKKNIEVSISGGTFTGVKAINESNPQSNDPAPQVTMSVTNGTFNGEVSTVDVNNFISGGTFSKEVPANCCAEDFKLTPNGDGTYSAVAKNYVAQIGDVKYESLAEAFEAATAGETIKLLADMTSGIEVPASTNAVLEFNGHKISNAPGIGIKNNGTLTLQNSQGEGGIDAKYPVRVESNSSTTIKSGTYSSVEGAVTIHTAVGATVTIDGGTFSASDNAVIAGNGSARDGEANTININGGTFNGGITSAGYIACGIYAPWKDVITVNGGTFNITDGCGILARAGTVTVKGGEFICTGNTTGKVGDSRVVVPCAAVVYDSQAGYPAQTDEAKIEVPSTSTAIFSSEVGVAAVAVVGDSHIEISGGTYSSPLSEDVCAEGYIPQDKGNGNYGAKIGTYVAQVGENKYETITEALNAIGEGQTITLIADVNEAVTNTNTNSFTIDLNGKTWTSDATSTFRNNGGTVTITDETGKGTIKNTANETDKGIAVWARTGSVVIKNGTFVSQSNYEATLYVGTSAANLGVETPTITVDGGTIKNEAEGKYAHKSELLPLTLNVINNITTYQAIIVKGGTFYGNDPSFGDDSQLGKINNNSNFVYSELHAKYENGVFVIEEGGYKAQTGYHKYVNLDDAIDHVDAATNKVTLLTDAETEKATLPANVTINANSKVLTMPSFVVLDGAAFTLPNVTGAETYKVRTATYIRTNISATEWGTVCLPFSLTNGNGVTYYTYNNISGTTLTVDETTGTVAPNTPVVFKKTTTDLEINEVDATVSLTPTPKNDGALVGTYADDNIAANGSIYFINGNYFHKAQVSVKVPAYRAYISYNVPSGAAPRSLSIVVGGENNETGVETITVDGVDVNAVYDMAGRKMQAPRKGMSIVKLANGKTVKLFVK